MSSSARFLALQIVFRAERYAQELQPNNIKDIVLIQHSNPLVGIVSRSNTRVVVHIVSSQLQAVYDGMLLNLRFNIKAFYLSANGPEGKHEMEVRLNHIPRPMISASCSKSAGHEPLSLTHSFNSKSSWSEFQGKDTTSSAPNPAPFVEIEAAAACPLPITTSMHAATNDTPATANLNIVPTSVPYAEGASRS